MMCNDVALDPRKRIRLFTREEGGFWVRSRSQIATLKHGKNIKYLRYAFTKWVYLAMSSHLLVMAFFNISEYFRNGGL